MTRPSILLCDTNPGNIAFFEEFLSDTRTQFLLAKDKKSLANTLLAASPQRVFIDSSLAESSFAGIEKLLNPETRIYLLGEGVPGPLAGAPVLALPLDEQNMYKVLFADYNFPEKIQVLVIDDEVEVCRSIKEFLELRSRPSFQVNYALNGLEGFNKIESTKPDVVILDIKMPVKNGSELFKQARKRFPEVKYIFVTATVAPEELYELKQHGAFSFVEKGAPGSTFAYIMDLIKKQIVLS